MGIFYVDYSKNLLDQETLDLLLALAEESDSIRQLGTILKEKRSTKPKKSRSPYRIKATQPHHNGRWANITPKLKKSKTNV